MRTNQDFGLSSLPSLPVQISRLSSELLRVYIIPLRIRAVFHTHAILSAQSRPYLFRHRLYLEFSNSRCSRCLLVFKLLLHQNSINHSFIARLVYDFGLRLHEGPVAFLLITSHAEECNNHSDPVKVVRKYTAVSRRVLPAENGIEDAPPAAAVELGIAAVNMPYAFVDVV